MATASAPDLAKQLIVKIATDAGFRNSLAAASTIDQKKAILEKAGYGAVKPLDVPASAFPASAQVEELDEAQLSRVASAANNTITTTTTTTTVFAGASAAVAAA